MTREDRTMPERWAEELAATEAELSVIQQDHGIEEMTAEDSPQARHDVISKPEDEGQMPERWADKLAQAEAVLAALQADYGIEGMLVEDSPKPRGSVIRPV